MTNINYVMDMTKSFLDGEINCMSYFLDFPFEVETRYRKMVQEDREYADLILECLVKEGTDKFNELSDTQFKRLIRKHYKYIKNVATLFVPPLTSFLNEYRLKFQWHADEDHGNQREDK